MNALLCIGCDKYQHLTTLDGAAKDATKIFGLLSGQQFYDKTCARILLDPTKEVMLDGLNASFPQGGEIDVFTFFFAGHSVVKSGSFYLCPFEADPDRLSTTAFPILALFSIINEFKPRQVNIVIDACEAGGSAFDLSQLLKPDVIGHSEACSITFLGACTSDQKAYETFDGGVLTQHLARCLTGEREIQSTEVFLDLIDVGAAVCQDVRANDPQQKPIYWGLSMFGEGRFSENPHFSNASTERVFPLGSVLPQSEMGKRIRFHSAALWEEYRTIKENPDPKRLVGVLATVFKDANGTADEMISSLRGLARTLSARAGESSELFAPSQCVAACAVSLLPSIESKAVQEQARVILRELVAMDRNIFAELKKSVETDTVALLSNAGVLSDLYYLPLRITQLLGWIGLSIIIESLLPDIADGENEARFVFASTLIDRYTDSLVVVSDEQAAPLYVFLKACSLSNRPDLATNVTNRYFASFAERRGNVTRAGVDGEQACRYIRSLGPEQFRPNDWRPANPSHLLPVLLLFGAKLGLKDAWDLRAIDRTFSAFFIPDDYRDFGHKVMERGMNYLHQIGFGVWKLSQFENEFDRARKERFTDKTVNFPKEGAALCTISSLLFPDRLPLLLEAV